MAGRDTLQGGTGNDTLDGGTGADTMLGGAGDDIYFVDNKDDTATEAKGSGTDTVYASVSYTLGSNVEKLVLTGTEAINGTGTKLDNVLVGNAAANKLDGGYGSDTLSGGLGNDTLTGDNGADHFVLVQGRN
jgi:Ca2+-binding RTX toxin-like protein